MDSLTGRYRQHIIEYTGEGHAVINGWLRGAALSRAATDFARSRVASIDTVLSTNPLVQKEVLHRIVDVRAFGVTRGDALVNLVGIQRIERGYLSTSRQRMFEMKTYDSPVHLDVIVPAGTPAAAVEHVSAVRKQFEVLLARDLEYVLRSAGYDGISGAWHATMRIIGRRDGG